MILDPKFLVGIAVGGVLGVMLAPQAGQFGIDLTAIKSAILARTTVTDVVTDKGNWPPDDVAKQQLFGLSKWDIKNFGNQSTVHVKRCMSIAKDSIACEMAAKLSWINEDTLLEGVFRGKPEEWTLVSVKTKSN